MIDTLDALPALTRSWIADLERADPELHAELALSLVVEAPGTLSGESLPAGISPVLAALALRGKEIGAFRFAPAQGDSAIQCMLAYHRGVAEAYAAPADLIFIGDYGAAILFGDRTGIGLFEPEHGTATPLASDFTAFLLVQASAYDAYKRHIVKAADEASYRAESRHVADQPRFGETQVQAIFDAQLRA